MPKFARGKFAIGLSDRSGKQYKLNEMKKESTGLMVGPDEYEEKHPQLKPPPMYSDPEALRKPRPDSAEVVEMHVLGPRFGYQFYYPIIAYPQVGNVTVTTT